MVDSWQDTVWLKSDTGEKKKMDVRYTFLRLSDLPDARPLPPGASNKQTITLQTTYVSHAIMSIHNGLPDVTCEDCRLSFI